ncbi:hypothetical protein SNE40_018096 [Patella caerulea]|uniref:Uncharacterized protein n=1 Tax=Patella caerulea TaxID=87958 RepID=A0AAN8J7S3_PATCE
MFMMVGVPETQRDYIRLLWWEDGNYIEPPIVYYINYHLFRAVSSPACCIFALRQTVHDNIGDFSEDVAEFVLNDFYMDDGCSSADSIDTAVNTAKGAIELCSRGRFNICKFASNSKPFLQQLPADVRSQDLTEFFVAA